MTSTFSSQPNDTQLALNARPSQAGRFGRFGGQYVPETLIPALDELEKAAKEAWKDKSFTDIELEGLCLDSTPYYYEEYERLIKAFSKSSRIKVRTFCAFL